MNIAENKIRRKIYEIEKQINRRRGVVVFLVMGLFAFASPSASAQEEKQNKNLARQAKITTAQARAIARKRAAGKIEGAELERENGKLIYSFDIRNAKGTRRSADCADC